MRLPHSNLVTLLFTINCANPSTIVDLPTPGSPINTGLFFFLLLNICITRSISLSLPTTRSSSPLYAANVRSLEKLSIVGVDDEFIVLSLLLFCEEFENLGGVFSILSSNSSSSLYMSFLIF